MSASTITYEIKAVTYIIDNAVSNKQSVLLSTIKGSRMGRRKQCQHFCLDRAYNSKSVKQQIINQSYVPHIPYKRKRVQQTAVIFQNQYTYAKNKRKVLMVNFCGSFNIKIEFCWTCF